MLKLFLTLLFSILVALPSSSKAKLYQGLNDWTNYYGVVCPKDWELKHFVSDLDHLWVEPKMTAVVSSEFDSMVVTNIYDTIESWELETVRTGYQSSVVIHNDDGTETYAEAFGADGESPVKISNGLFYPIWTNRTDRVTLNVSRYLATKDGQLEPGADISKGLNPYYPFRAVMRYMSFVDSACYYRKDAIYRVDFDDHSFSLTNELSVTEKWTLSVLGQVPDTLQSKIGIWQCTNPLAGATENSIYENGYANHNPLTYITANSELINQGGSELNPLVSMMYELSDMSDQLAFEISFDGNSGYTLGGGAEQVLDGATWDGSLVDSVYLNSKDGEADSINITVPAGTFVDGKLYESVHTYVSLPALSYECFFGGLHDDLNGENWDRMNSRVQWFIGNASASMYNIVAKPGNQYTEDQRSISKLSVYEIDDRRRVYTEEGYDGDDQYERNPDCFAASLDLTPASPWNSQYGNLRAGTLISPRHILMARHYKIGVGHTVDFVSMDNELVRREIVANYSIPYFWMDEIEPADSFDRTIYDDYTIGVLDEDVPLDKISFCKVLPKKFWEYLPAGMYGIPMLRFDKSECVSICVGASPGQHSSLWYPSHLPSIPAGKSVLDHYDKISTFEHRTEHKLSSAAVNGDSGNPVIAYLKNMSSGEYEAVLTQLTSAIGTTTFSPSLSIYYDAINEIMAYPDGGGYQLTPIDLSQYGTAKSHAKEY